MRCSRGGPGNNTGAEWIVVAVLVGDEAITLRMVGEDGEEVRGGAPSG